MKENQFADLLPVLQAHGVHLACAESCTGGLIAAEITAVPGASEVFDCGVVSYSNGIKEKILGVSGQTLARFGAVSHETAREMASGVRKLAAADLAISSTGIAGPGGGSAEKPVGLVYVGLSAENVTRNTENRFSGSREEIRRQTVCKAAEMLRDYLKEMGYLK